MGLSRGSLCGIAVGFTGRISYPEQARPLLHRVPTRNLHPTFVDELHNSPEQRSAVVSMARSRQNFWRQFRPGIVSYGLQRILFAVSGRKNYNPPDRSRRSLVLEAPSC